MNTAAIVSPCSLLGARARASHAVWWVLRHVLTRSDGLKVGRLLGAGERHRLYVDGDAVWLLADEAKDGAQEIAGGKDCDRQATRRKVRRMGRLNRSALGCRAYVWWRVDVQESEPWKGAAVIGKEHYWVEGCGNTTQ